MENRKTSSMTWEELWEDLRRPISAHSEPENRKSPPVTLESLSTLLTTPISLQSKFQKQSKERSMTFDDKFDAKLVSVMEYLKKVEAYIVPVEESICATESIDAYMATETSCEKEAIHEQVSIFDMEPSLEFHNASVEVCEHSISSFGVDALFDQQKERLPISHVEERDVLSQTCTDFNDKQSAPHVLGKMSPRVQRKRKFLKAWKFKFKTRNLQRIMSQKSLHKFNAKANVRYTISSFRTKLGSMWEKGTFTHWRRMEQPLMSSSLCTIRRRHNVGDLEHRICGDTKLIFVCVMKYEFGLVNLQSRNQSGVVGLVSRSLTEAMLHCSIIGEEMDNELILYVAEIVLWQHVVYKLGLAAKTVHRMQVDQIVEWFSIEVLLVVEVTQVKALYPLLVSPPIWNNQPWGYNKIQSSNLHPQQKRRTLNCSKTWMEIQMQKNIQWTYLSLASGVGIGSGINGFSQTQDL